MSSEHNPQGSQKRKPHTAAESIFILVDKNKTKAHCHRGFIWLHNCFSLFSAPLIPTVLVERGAVVRVRLEMRSFIDTAVAQI